MRKRKRRAVAPGVAAGSNGAGAEAAGVFLALPDAGPTHAYACRALNLRITHSQARALRRLLEGADVGRRSLRCGRRVATTPDALRWLLEQLDDAQQTTHAQEGAEGLNGLTNHAGATN